MKKFGRTFSAVLLLAAVAWMGHLVYQSFTRPSYWEAAEIVDGQTEGMHSGNADKLKVETKRVDKWKRDVDIESFRNAILPSATRAAGIDTARNAWYARAEGRLPIGRVTETGVALVRADQNSWLMHFTASEPLLVAVSPNDQACTAGKDECAFADGIYREGTPSFYAGNKTVIQDSKECYNISKNPGGYRSLIARTPADGCVETGFVFAACPALDRSTPVELWTNAYTQAGNIRTRQDYSNAPGGYTYEVLLNDPRAQAACRANPSAGIVRIPALTPDTVLVSTTIR